MKRLTTVVSFICAFAILSNAQEPKKEIDELRLKLNEDGSHYIKATFLNQVWFRYNNSNPGTLLQNEPTPTTFDIGLRRTRFQLYGQLTDHVFFYFQWGQNNFNSLSQNAGNRKLMTFFHDALGEYKFKKGSEILVLGGGITLTNGLSRFSQPSITTIMTMDVPVFAQATVDQTDEFSRKLSMYARGQLGKFDYRLVITDPFPINTNGQPLPVLGTNATFATDGHYHQYQGFFMWNFFDKEQHTTPYMTGTYLGKKKVFNLEGGFITQQKATESTPDNGVTKEFHDLNLWSIAVFYDAPLNAEKGTAISAYVGYFDYNYGPGYLRYNGIMNPANGLEPGYPAGSYGNAFPMFGTGQAVYAQFGYLLTRDLLGADNGTLMPYASLMNAKWDRLDKTMNVWDVGLNWFIKGHTSKFTLDYQHRPYYFTNGNTLQQAGARGQWVLQYQIFF